MLPAPLCSFLEPNRHISVPPASLQSWFIASSRYPFGKHGVVYVTIQLLFDNIGGTLTFVGCGVCVCVSHEAITCSYRILWLGHQKTPKWLAEHHFWCWRRAVSWALLAAPGLSWQRQGSLSDFRLVGQLSLKFRLSHIPMSSSGSGHPWKARGAVSCVCLVAPLQGLVGA